MENKIHYLNNGKVAQNYSIHSTTIRNTKSKNIKATNGKLFPRELNIKTEENEIRKTNQNKKNENTYLTSWLINTLNPINHIPIISTINKMADKTNKSLDIVQSAIGGAIYGGGPIGLAKGIGGWVLNKLFPINKIAIKSKSTKEMISSNNILRENNKSLENKTSLKKSIQPSKIDLKNEKKDTMLIDNLSPEQTKSLNNIFYHYYEKPKQERNVIDTDA